MVTAMTPSNVCLAGETFPLRVIGPAVVVHVKCLICIDQDIITFPNSTTNGKVYGVGPGVP